jgi:hypothetical protein
VRDYVNPIQKATQPARFMGNVPRIVTPRMSGGMGRLADYVNVIQHATMPARSLPTPPGPADTPVNQANPTPASLRDLLDQLRQNNNPQRGVFRNLAIGAGLFGTLDWSMLGMMSRVVLYNNGPNTVFFAWDTSGQQIDAFISDNSWPLYSGMSYNADTVFYKIGLRCAAGASGTVSATAWPSPSSGQGLVV